MSTIHENSSSDDEFETESLYENAIAEPRQLPTHRPRIQVFKGNGKDEITIENWFKLIDIMGRKHGWSNIKKLEIVCEYLEGEAINYYLDVYDNCDWPELKGKMIKRFGVKTHEPITEFLHTKYDKELGVDDYFNKRRRLAMLAGFTEKQAVVMMVDGLDDKMKMCLVSHHPETYDSFYVIAKKAEMSLKKIDHDSVKTEKKWNPNRTKPFEKKDDKKKSKVMGPCFTCEKNGKLNQYHWNWDCPSKKAVNVNYQSFEAKDGDKDEEKNPLN